MWITLDQIECLVAISESGSLTSAAERLGRAKSAIHYSIKKLEEQVGFEIVDTGGYRGRLTSQGEQLLLKSKPVVAMVEELKQAAHQIATGVELKVAISASALYSLQKFNRVIAKVQKRFSNTEIVFHREILSGEKMLRQGIVDVAVTEQKIGDDEFEARVLGNVRLFMVISKSHPFLTLEKKEQTEANLFQYPQVVQRSTLPDDDLQGVYKKSKRWTVSDLASKKEIILSGLGWGRLPEYLVAEDLKNQKLVCLDEISQPIDLPMYLCRRSNSQPGGVVDYLWEHL